MPEIPETKVLLKAALNRANKASAPLKEKSVYIREINIMRINRAARYVKRHIRRMVRWWLQTKPNINPFYMELLSILVDIEDFNKCVIRLQGALRIIETLQMRYIKTIKTREPKSAGHLWKEFFGRLSSVIRRNKKCINLLREARSKLIKLPSIDVAKPTIVVAGPPNVGKSSLVARISTGKPSVASYPFTTKQVSLGHIYVNKNVLQIMDTPGLLDRPLENRNKVELQAITALNNIASYVIFMFDPSETCGYPFNYQLSVYRSVSNLLLGKPGIIVLNKMDVLGYVVPESIRKLLLTVHVKEWIPISTLTGYGIDELLSRLKKSFL